MSVLAHKSASGSLFKAKERLFKNVVAPRYIGGLSCLINQATTKILGVKSLQNT